ncbi:MAG: OmpA family protein [Saprospiraceae bacterium]|nr:OmpA family protein [Saprospiraceae bacterium]
MINYKNNEFELSEDQKKNINNYLKKFSKKYQAFKVIGHTDERGSDNESLSIARAMKFINLFLAKRQLTQMQFLYWCRR